MSSTPTLDPLRRTLQGPRTARGEALSPTRTSAPALDEARAKVRRTDKARAKARTEFDVALLDALDAGVSYGKLAEDLGITRASVQSRVRSARGRLNE